MDRIKQLLQALVTTTFALVPLVLRPTGTKVLRNFLQLPARSFGGARSLVALPFVVGLLAVTLYGGSAQCYRCGWSDEWPFPHCAPVEDGWSDCIQPGGEDPDQGSWQACDTGGDACEDVWAMDASTDRKAITTVMEGDMLAADTGYFFIVDGSDKVLRRKCSGAFVARITEADQRLAFDSRIQGPGLERPLPWSFGAAQPVRAGQG
ncbi:MAG: hypothetical protein OXI83_04360 [Gemmatimonadota bacterium]|nr:hypothetical protein [Gemmatimonadota bacterium]